jgi:OOP family OmpA-OmpF porin
VTKTPAISAPITAASLILACGLIASPFLDSGHSGGSAGSSLIQDDIPRFEIFWLRGELRLAGHTLSRQHEEDLLRVTADFYPGHAKFTSFEPLGLVPDYWVKISIQTLTALAVTMSAHAILSPNELIIRGISGDRSGWPDRLLALRQSLPANVKLSVNVLTISNDFPLAYSCDKALGQFTTGPIHFEKSSANFRSSAYPVLDRLVAITSVCSTSEILITGHTDSSGNETLNLKLSLRRAHAVADYIEHGGVAAARMIVAGAGSSEPITDNDSGYGRSLNRRIEIVLKPTQP